MAAKAEISWKRTDEAGEKVQVYVHHVGDQWLFYWRYRRFDQWEPLKFPPLEDWMELLDAVRRRVQRRLLRPEEIGRIEKRIRELFPEADINETTND
ncbi:MAG TPA: hypothetical protein VJ063_08335 [Verrucomicrobiae bacterium]|nr:hypothetical protein [Verrucomicrobiae bacterium]